MGGNQTGSHPIDQSMRDIHGNDNNPNSEFREPQQPRGRSRDRRGSQRYREPSYSREPPRQREPPYQRQRSDSRQSRQSGNYNGSPNGNYNQEPHRPEYGRNERGGRSQGYQPQEDRRSEHGYGGWS